MKTNCGIYKITNVINNKVYIGSSVNLKSRKRDHFLYLSRGKHANKHLQYSYNVIREEYKKDDIRDYFKFSILKEIDKIEDRVKLKESLLEWEQYYIDDLKACDPSIGYNMRIIASSNLGMKLGKRSKEVKEKISLGNKGKIRSKQFRLNLSKLRKDIPLSEEHRNNIKENNGKRKRVINLTTNMIFDSIREASRYYKVGHVGISNNCLRKQKTAYGYTWSYYN